MIGLPDQGSLNRKPQIRVSPSSCQPSEKLWLFTPRLNLKKSSGGG